MLNLRRLSATFSIRSPPVHNLKEPDDLLFENMRIGRDEISRLDWNRVTEFAPLYHSTNVKALAAFGRRIKKRRPLQRGEKEISIVIPDTGGVRKSEDTAIHERCPVQ